MSIGKVVKIVVGGENWHYQSFCDEDTKETAIRVYGSDGEFAKEFSDADEMTKWLFEETERKKRKSREKMQETFMRRFEQVKGNLCDADFAVNLGMPRATVYQYLTGRRFPTVEAMAQISERCGVTIDWLVGLD